MTKSVDMVFFCVRMKPKNQLLTNLKLIIMKRIIFVCVALVTLVSCAFSQSYMNERRRPRGFFFFAPSVGTSIRPADEKGSKPDVGVTVSGSLGYTLNSGVIFEGEGAYTRIASHNVYQMGLGVGYDIPSFETNSPYFVVGFGAVMNQPCYDDETRPVDPYLNYKVGWNFAVVRRWVDIGVEYRGDCMFALDKSHMVSASTPLAKLSHSLAVVLRLYMPY